MLDNRKILHGQQKNYTNHHYTNHHRAIHCFSMHVHLMLIGLSQVHYFDFKLCRMFCCPCSDVLREQNPARFVVFPHHSLSQGSAYQVADSFSNAELRRLPARRRSTCSVCASCARRVLTGGARERIGCVIVRVCVFAFPRERSTLIFLYSGPKL